VIGPGLTDLVVPILVVNAGSSTLKLRVLDGDDSVVASADLSPGGDVDETVVGDAVSRFGALDAVGHRIVHGGALFKSSVLIDDRVEHSLRSLVDLAPLHQPKALAALQAVKRAAPGLPAIACFDTAFHSTLSPTAFTYAVPHAWRDLGVRRYGFHGLSHAYAARRARELIPGRERLRVVTCHLGAGASLAAVDNGVSVDTTMGFTPLEGLVMATRSGSIDPGVIPWVQRHAHLSPVEITDALEHRSGMVALAGTPDMRAVLDAAARGDERARLARDVYVHRLRGAIAAMAAALEGIDGLVFTGGVGENAPAIRASAARGLGFLGIGLDPRSNTDGAGDRDVTSEDARVRTVVISAREDVEIAREVRRVLGRG
jgi:acetate kinase